jgi:hypothetical protein
MITSEVVEYGERTNMKDWYDKVSNKGRRKK